MRTLLRSTSFHVFAVAAAMSLASCSAPLVGASNPSPGQLSSDAISGLLHASNVNYSGTLEALGTPYTVHVTVNQKGDFHGTLSFSTRSVEVIKVGSQMYHKGRTYWAGTVDPVTTRVYADNWVLTEAAQDETPLFTLAASEVERDLRDHFKPSQSSVRPTSACPTSGGTWSSR